MTHSNPYAGLYHPVEHRILAEYLECPALVDVCSIDPWTTLDEETDHVGLQSSLGGYSTDEYAFANAVARLVLEHAQDRLPQWAAFYRDGSALFGRHYQPVHRRPVDLLPQHLFTINWADSAPGMSWPEAYHAAYLPGYERFVVTASADSEESSSGYTDWAIGHFQADQDLQEGAQAIITTHWAQQLERYNQYPWAYLFDTGAVSEEQAYRWRYETWIDAAAKDADIREILGADGEEE